MKNQPDRREVYSCITLNQGQVDGVTLEKLPAVLLERMRLEDSRAELWNTTVEVELDHDFYSQCSCQARLRLAVKRPETAEEQAARLQAEERAKQATLQQRKERRKLREEQDRKTYERLRAKFEKPTKGKKS